MAFKIRVLIAKNDKDSFEVIKQSLESFSDIKVIGETNTAAEVIDMSLKFQPDIIIMGINMALSEGMEICAKVNQMLPYIGIILVGYAENVDTIRLAMQSGASDFLEPPVTSLKLYNSITSVSKIKQEQRNQLLKSPLIIPQKGSKTISVFSSKGGVGKTVLATNIAVALEGQTREEVLLVDLDLQFGDVADMLDIIPKTSIADLVNSGDINEANELNKYIISHSSGIKILPAPHDAEQADQVTRNDLKVLIPMLSKIFDYIVIDLPPLFNQVTLAAIEASDYLLILTTMEIPTLKNVKESLDILRKIEYPEENIFIVINRYSKNSDIKINDIKKFLGIQKSFCINDCPDIVSSSINSGEPIVLMYRDSEITKQLVMLSDALIDYRNVLVRNTSKSLLSRILKRMKSKDE